MPFIIYILLLILPLSVPTVSCQEAQKPLRVGAVVALSGPAALHGESIKNGLLLAADSLAAQGKKIELVFEDDGSNSSKTVSAIQSLHARGINFFIGMTWSFQAEGAAPALKRIHALGMAPACSSEIAGGPSPGLLFGTNSSSEKAPVLEEWFKKEKIHTAAMIYASSGWGTVHEKIFREVAQKAGVTITTVNSYNYGDEATAIPSLVSKLKSTMPDGLFITGSKEGSSLLVKKLNDFKMKVKVLRTDDIKDADLAGILPHSTEDVPLSFITLPIADEFKMLYKKKFKTDPYVYSDSAYDMLTVLSAAYSNTSGAPADVRAYLLAAKSFPGLSGPISFDANGDVHRNQYVIEKIQ